MPDINTLIYEIKNGEIKRDMLTDNNVLGFCGEAQAAYFSKLRRNLSSETAHEIMTCFQDNRSLALLNDMHQ